MSQRRSAQTLRVVDTLNIASFERVAYKSAAKESLGTLRKQHQDQRASLDAAVREAYQRVEDEQPVMLALPGGEVARTSRCWCSSSCSCRSSARRRWICVSTARCVALTG